MAKSLYLILPSNVTDYSNNTTAEYRVKLPRSIRLEGRWEVALTEIQYPHSWDNLREVTTEGVDPGVTIPDNMFFIDMKSYQQLYKDRSGGASPPTADSRLGEIQLVLPFEIQPGIYDNAGALLDAIHFSMRSWPKEVRGEGDEKVSIRDRKWERMVVEANGQYQEDDVRSVLNFYESFVSSPGQLFQLKYNNNTRRVSWTLDTENAVGAYLSQKLQYVLGISSAQSVHLIKEREGFGTFPVDLTGGFNTIYVYCNLVEPQIVGNSLVPLLRAVVVEGKHGDYLNKIFLTPYYLELRTKYFDSVEIAIKSDTNKPVPFNFGKVIVKLHLRQIREYD